MLLKIVFHKKIFNASMVTASHQLAVYYFSLTLFFSFLLPIVFCFLHYLCFFFFL